MRIAIMGAGAVGGYFGALLARAGHDVTFIARGAHLAALRTRGLTLTGPRGDHTLHPVNAVDDPARVGPVDVVLFCVKLYDTESAAAAVKPLVSHGGVCITVQNGVDARERIAGAIGAQNVMGGFALVSGLITEPGVIRYTSEMSALTFGEPDGASSPRAIAFRDACRAAGFQAEVSADIRSAQWTKFVGLCSNAALSCVVRQPAGIVYHQAETIALAQKAFAEVATVGRAQGLALPEDVEERMLKVHQSFPRDMYASMFHDLRQGRRLELESLSGLVVRRGSALGVPTPVHEFAYAVLKPYADGAPQL